jgi:hypothetical protein
MRFRTFCSLLLAMFPLFGSNAQTQCCWDALNTPSGASRFSDFKASYFCSPETGFFAGVNGVIKTTDRGESWKVVNTETSVTGIYFESPKLGVVVGGRGYFATTSDGGDTWQESRIDTAVDFSKIVCRKDGFQVLVGNRSTIMLSNDHGTTWTRAPIAANIRYTSCAMADSMIACVGVFVDQSGGVLTISTDRGVTWEHVPQGYVSRDICFINPDSALLCSGSTRGIAVYDLRTRLETLLLSDSKYSWYSLAFSPRTRKIAAGGTHGSTAVSTDMGVSWQLCMGVGGYDNNRTVCITESDQVFIGGYDSAFRSCGLLTSEPADDAGALELDVFPTPTRGEMSIAFSIPRETDVALTVYDALGRVIATLAHEKLQPGKHRKNWSTREFAPGMYYVRLSAGTSLKTSPMIALH